MFSPWVDKKLLEVANWGLSRTGMKLLSRAEYASVLDQKRSAELDADFLRLIGGLEGHLAAELISVLPFSKSQLRQDLVVLEQCSAKRQGFFVEFGATDGVNLSNTWLLEKKFGWTGILAEPAQVWHDSLRKSRSCNIDLRCVAQYSGQTVAFLEAEAPELSTLATFRDADSHQRQGVEYMVETVSLDDLLLQHRAPQGFDYLSIDTEGSELEILENFDLAFWRPRVVTVEHNYSPAKVQLGNFFGRNGYRQVHSSISRWESWFVRT